MIQFNTFKKCRDVERVMIVTDHAMVELGFLDRIIEQLDLRRNKVVYQIFADVEPDPDITTVERGTESCVPSNQIQSSLLVVDLQWMLLK